MRVVSMSYDSIRTKVVGSTFGDGQEIIRTLKEGERLLLIPEPENPVDSNAILVKTLDGRKIGHIQKELAKEWSPLMLVKNVRYKATIL